MQFPPIMCLFERAHMISLSVSHTHTHTHSPMYLKQQRGCPTEFVQMQEKEQHQPFAECSRRVVFTPSAGDWTTAIHYPSKFPSKSGLSCLLGHNFTTPTCPNTDTRTLHLFSAEWRCNGPHAIQVHCTLTCRLLQQHPPLCVLQTAK